MSTQEFYIRGENDVEARGPFTQDQLASLVEAEQVDGATLYYDATIEQWVPINSNASLMAFLFPEKKRLKVRPKDDVETLNVFNENDAPIRVEDMLAAAEGKTAETAGRGDPRIAAERVAGAGRHVLILLMALSVFALLMPLEDKDSRLAIVYSLDWMGMVTNPFILFGLFDIFLLVMLLLGATTIYPVLRFRAVVGLGFFSLVFFCADEPLPLLAQAAGAVGIYLVTVSLSWVVLLPAALVGLAGVAGFAYWSVFL